MEERKKSRSISNICIHSLVLYLTFCLRRQWHLTSFFGQHFRLFAWFKWIQNTTKTSLLGGMGWKAIVWDCKGFELGFGVCVWKSHFADCRSFGFFCCALLCHQMVWSEKYVPAWYAAGTSRLMSAWHGILDKRAQRQSWLLSANKNSNNYQVSSTKEKKMLLLWAFQWLACMCARLYECVGVQIPSSMIFGLFQLFALLFKILPC